MPFCTKCGTEVPENVNFCTKCGNAISKAKSVATETKQASKPKPANKPKSGSKPLIIAIIAIAAVAVLSAGGYIAYKKLMENSGDKTTLENTKSKDSLASTVQIDSFTDPRDNKKYKTVKIGNQTWMAENLSYNANGSKCYDNNTANCNTYGRMYNWETAMKACPSGWHLPTKAEWETLTDAVGGKTAGKHLKTASGWNNVNDKSGNGSDTYSFAALPGGSQFSGKSHMLGNNGYWWSATENDDGSTAYYQFMLSESEETGWNNKGKSLFLSVRCVKD